MDISLLIMIAGGFTLGLLIIVVLSGMRIIKIGVKTHKRLALIVLTLSLFHGIFSYLFFTGKITF
jgi:hypothetical protein